MRPLIAVVVMLTLAGACLAGDLPAWEFDRAGDLEGWEANRALTGVEVKDGFLHAQAVGDDPILYAPEHPFATAMIQRVEVRMASDRAGVAELFWAPDREGRFGGFRQDRSLRFHVFGDGAFHTYELYPFWQGDPQILRLRLDPPDDAAVRIDWVRVTEAPLPRATAAAWDFADGAGGWQALRDVEIAHDGARLIGRVTGPEPLLMSPQMEPDPQRHWLTLRMGVDRGEIAEALIISGGVPGIARRSFPIVADGRPHTYNLLTDAPDAAYTGVIAVGLSPSLEVGARFEIAAVAVGAAPGGPAEIKLVALGPVRAVNRADREARLRCVIRNRGGERVGDLRATLHAAEGFSIVGAATQAATPAEPLRFGRQAEFQWTLRPASPGEVVLVVAVEGDAIEPQTFRGSIAFTPPQPATPAMIDGRPYVPEPQPVRGEFEVGVYYFPGWRSAGSWAPIDRAGYPLPYLGFYREGEPEVADWHIKWAVEHGITFFIYDWYWCQGATNLMHALHDGYLQARYRDYLKFCLLWANHNPPGTSSEEDLLAVTRFWLDHYFRLPQYQTIEGKPLMIIFSPERLRQDMGSEAVREAFEKMRQMCRDEGLPGLYLAACAMPADAARLAREGYDAATGYNYPHAGAEGKLRAPYDTMVTGFEEIWRDFLARDQIKLIVPLSPGWDSRPWHGDQALVRYGNTADKFEDMCRRAKSLLQARPPTPENRMVVIEAWNEFGEGSYIEPTKEFGFSQLDAVRRVFTDAPDQHLDLVPEDLGLGPYEVTMRRGQRAWEFDTPGDDEGWGSVMGMTDVHVSDGVLVGVSTTNDPAFFGPAIEVDAEEYRRVVVRMRAWGDDLGQLFWSSSLLPTSEATSIRFPVVGDGEFHEYVLDVGSVPTWAGEIQRLRLDPGIRAGARFEVDYIRVVE